MFNMSIRVVGLEGLLAKSAEARAWAKAPFRRNVALQIRDAFTEEATTAFATKGSGIGHPWPALSRKYAAYKSAKYPGRPLMVRSGKLANSLTNETDRNFLFSNASGRSLTLGTRVKYAKYHQQGVQGRLPARPLVVATKRLAENVAAALSADLEAALRKAE